MGFSHIFQIFSIFFKSSGMIDSQELRKAISALGLSLSKEGVDKMIAEVDQNGDGYIDFEEFQVFFVLFVFLSFLFYSFFSFFCT